MRHKITILSTILLIISQLALSQVQMGGWRTHFSYNIVNQIEQSKNKIFALSEGSLFSIDKRDQSIELYSKASGLNDTNISAIGYDSKSQTLVITYKNGNIDFMRAGGVKNLPDFHNKQMSADKSVNHIMFDGNNGYLSCSFGIMVLNLDKIEIQDTYYIGNNAESVAVQNTTLLDRTIYASTADTIFFADIDNPEIINYEKWQTMNNLPGSGKITAIHTFGDKLILLRGNKLYSYQNNAWNNIDHATNYTQIKTYPTQLMAFTGSKPYLFDQQLNKKPIDNIEGIKGGLLDNQSSKIWLIGNEKGIAAYTPTEEQLPTINYYKPNGPAVNSPYRMKFGGERLFVVPGGRWAAQFNQPGKIMIFEENEWTNIDNSSITKITKRRANDFMDVAIDPNDNKHFFVTSYGNGVFEFQNDTLAKAYTFENSTLKSATAVPNSFYYIRIDGASYDQEGNVWFSNNEQFFIRYQILKKDGTWSNIEKKSDGYPHPSPLLISAKSRLKWNLSFRGLPGIALLDDNGTIDEPNDDKYKFFSSFTDNIKEGIFTPSNFFCIVEDKRGAIWVGTDKGPIVLHSTENIFQRDLTFSRVVIPRNDGTDVGDILLENQGVSAIAVDGANRKWMGTKESGVYLLSEDGKETIKHFTTNNSPLPSNNILSIALNPTTGEVFFGTENGLVSYQSDAAFGGETFDNVYVYPNPVRENYNGLITITGLIDNSYVKITDVAGNLISESRSNGSIATWDGKNSFGEKVSSGVYLFNCTAPDSSKSITKKVLIIN